MVSGIADLLVDGRRVFEHCFYQHQRGTQQQGDDRLLTFDVGGSSLFGGLTIQDGEDIGTRRPR